MLAGSPLASVEAHVCDHALIRLVSPGLGATAWVFKKKRRMAAVATALLFMPVPSQQGITFPISEVAYSTRDFFSSSGSNTEQMNLLKSRPSTATTEPISEAERLSILAQQMEQK